MKELPASDLFCLRAAAGWLELGNPAEAKAELSDISTASANHYAVLEMRWQIASEEKDWESALEIARKLIQVEPVKAAGYVCQAYALRRVKNGGLEKAYAALLPATRLFPEETIIHYNLACYEAQLGQLDAAWERFQQALQVSSNATELLRKSLQEEDLKPLWGRIKAWMQGKPGAA